MISESIETQKKQSIKVFAKRYLADIVTPVSIYMRIRDQFGGGTALLESTDFRSLENCFSFIVADPIASFQAKGDTITKLLPDGSTQIQALSNKLDVGFLFNEFIHSFEVEANTELPTYNGFFGHATFESVQYFDTLTFDESKRKLDLPELNYSLYRYVIAINHFKNELYIIQNTLGDEAPNLSKIENLINNRNFGVYTFETEGEEKSNLTDEEYIKLVTLGKHHCQVGDVFQIVLSRQFSQQFKGDEFNVYRALRSINPSPYLFYFDYGGYKIFGSSPESQIVIQNQTACISPIAGTYKRTGNDELDLQKAEELAKDPKENAEHIMLVDLARNDLGRHAKKVRVSSLKEIHYYSHVIHLVSKVLGDLAPDTNTIAVFGDTFPAGTLSGAPKYKAIELISQYENQNRSFYGGAIGLIDFKGNMNQAIVIRSFLSRNNTLYYQAGAGIVAASVEASELQEVNNKLGALKKALLEAEKI